MMASTGIPQARSLQRASPRVKNLNDWICTTWNVHSMLDIEVRSGKSKRRVCITNGLTLQKLALACMQCKQRC